MYLFVAKHNHTFIYLLFLKDGVPLPKPRSQVEIKYEDDIEEEDYDSEDSETPSSVHMVSFFY